MLHLSLPVDSFLSWRSDVAVKFLEDEEIDFEKVNRKRKVFLPKSLSYTMARYCLAVEGT
jgi:hypothetical protein